MWMQKTMEGLNFAANENHQRSTSRQSFASPHIHQRNHAYGQSDRPIPCDDGASNDWKTKLVEGGQWLGGKVIELGGRLARGNSHTSIPDQWAQQQHPRNDGRASWMAEIRTTSASMQNSNGNGCLTAYQNEFTTQRPPAYTDSTYSSKLNSFSYTSKTQEAPFYSEDEYKEGTRSRRKKKQSHRQNKHDKRERTQNKKHTPVSESCESEADSISEAPSGSLYTKSANESESEIEHSRSLEKKGRLARKKSRSTRKHTKSRSITGSGCNISPKAHKEASDCDHSDAHERKGRLANRRTRVRENSDKVDGRRKKQSSRRNSNHTSSLPSDSSTDSEHAKRYTIRKQKRKEKGRKTTEIMTMDLLGVGEFEETATTSQSFMSTNLESAEKTMTSTESLDMLEGLQFVSLNRTEDCQLASPPAREAVSDACMEMHGCYDTLEDNLVKSSLIGIGSSNLPSKDVSCSKKTLNDMKREQQPLKPVMPLPNTSCNSLVMIPAGSLSQLADTSPQVESNPMLMNQQHAQVFMPIESQYIPRTVLCSSQFTNSSSLSEKQSVIERVNGQATLTL